MEVIWYKGPDCRRNVQNLPGHAQQRMVDTAGYTATSAVVQHDDVACGQAKILSFDNGNVRVQERFC
jgi:hypothetical protein